MEKEVLAKQEKYHKRDFFPGFHIIGAKNKRKNFMKLNDRLRSESFCANYCDKKLIPH